MEPPMDVPRVFENRIKFQKLDQRVAQARSRVDVVHKVKEPVEFLLEQQDKALADAGVDATQTTCLFREHLLKYMELNTSKAFQSLGRSLMPLSGSLPEVLHHLERIVGLLTSHLATPWGPAHDTALLLLSVLAKEVGSELYERGQFHVVMACLVSALDPSSPEASSRCFQTMSYLFKHLSRPIAANLDSLKRYYGPLLGHPKQYLRRFAAESLSLLLRRLEAKALTKHLKSVFKAAATALEKGGGLQAAAQEAEGADGAAAGSANKRGRDLLDGLSLLLFHTVRGLESQGQLHSCAAPVLKWLMEQQQQASAEATKGASLVLVVEAVAEGSLTYLCPHLKPAHAEPLWAEATRDLARLAVLATQKQKQQQQGEKEAPQSAEGLRRRLHLLTLLVRYRKGWLLTDGEVKRCQCVALARISRSLTEGWAYMAMSVAARQEVVQLLLALLDWQAYRASPIGKTAPSVSPEEGGLRRAVARALGVAFTPGHGLDETRMGEWAGRALAHLSRLKTPPVVGEEGDDDMEVMVGEEQEDEAEHEQHMVALLGACLTRWLEPACPSSTRLSLLRAIMLSSPNASGLRAVKHAQLKALAQAMVAQIAAAAAAPPSSSPSADVLVALRCLPCVLEALSASPGHKQDGKLVKEAIKRVTPLTKASSGTKKGGAGQEEEEGTLARSIHGQAVLACLRLHQLGDGQPQPQPAVVSDETRRQLAAPLVASLCRAPDCLLRLKALHQLLQLGSDVVSAKQSEELRGALAANLRSRSHLTRLLSLRVLAALAPLPYLEATTPQAQQQQRESPYVGPCPAMALALEAEALPISVSVERDLAGRLGRLEVMARSGYVPTPYLEALASHCVGLLHVKFAVVWPLACQTFATLAEAAVNRGPEGAEALWRPIEQTWQLLDRLLAHDYATEQETVDEEANAELRELRELLAPSSEAADKVDGEEVEVEGGWERVAFIVDEDEDEMGPASRRAGTDPVTSLSSLFTLLKKAPPLVVRRAKALTDLFLGFLHRQYFGLYPDDPEARELQLANALEQEAHDDSMEEEGGRLISGKAARAKLVGFLDLFSSVSGARQAARQALLDRVFRAFLARPDAAVAKAALECVLVSKPKGVTPYAAHLRALLDDHSLRDELVKFSLARDVQPEHRLLFTPVLVRVLFGRFLAKSVKAKKRSSKDAPAARRSAIVSFLAGAQEPAEFREFVHLMLRPFLLDATRPFTQPGNLTVAGVSTPRRLGFVHLLRSVTRQMGFHIVSFVPHFLDLLLGLLQDASASIAVKAIAEEEEVPDAEEEDEEAEEEEEEEEGGKQKGASSGGAAASALVPSASSSKPSGRSSSHTSVRPLALRALTELVAQFSEAVDLQPYSQRLWAILGPSVSHLPSMCSSASQPPSLLSLLVVLAQDASVLPVYRALEQQLTPTLIACLSVGPRSPVAAALLDILDRLLEQDGPSLLLPYLPDLVHHLSLRLAKAPNSDPLLERELSLLCRTGQMAAELVDREGEEGDVAPPDSQALSTLFSLLLPRLKTRVLREEIKGLVLGAYATLVRHMADPRKDVMQLSRLLGPAGLTVGMGLSREKPLREALVAALRALAARDDLQDLRPAMELVVELNALDESALEGRDLERCMPVWTRLAEQGAWRDVMAAAGQQQQAGGVSLVPLVSHCLASLHDEEVVIRVAASGALRAMVRTAAEASSSEGPQGGWQWLLTAVLIPALRAGLSQQADSVRQGYVMTLAEVVRCGRSPSCWFSSSEAASALHVDLSCLLRDDDPEMDFFHNITHIQIHRRSRALLRLRQLLEQQGSSSSPAFGSATLVHVLLPLACQPLLYRPHVAGGKTNKPLDPGLLQEALLTVGRLAQHVSWSHYHAVLRRFLRELSLSDGEPSSRDKALVSCLCHVLDAFHFPMTQFLPPAPQQQQRDEDAMDVEATEQPQQEEEDEEEEGDEEEEEEEGDKALPEERDEDEEEEGKGEAAGSKLVSAQAAAAPAAPRPNSVWRIMRTQILPGLRALLLKQVKDKKTGGKLQVLRAPMALAILKIIKLLPPADFNTQLTRLLMTVCTALRSRDSTAREGARSVLCSLLQDLGAEYLPCVLHELCMALKEGGYQMHIRVFTLHALLRSLADTYQPPVDAPSYPVPGVAGLPQQQEGEGEVQVVRPGLDSCVKDVLQVLLDDIFGETAGAKEAETEVKSATIKEAKGQKALDALELLGRLVLFRPTYAVTSPDDPAAVSSVHALVSPLLWQLHDSESPKMHGKVKQALQRVVTGLSQNVSLRPQEVLLYVYGLISPFLEPAGASEDGMDVDGGQLFEEDSSSDESDEDLALGDATRAKAAAKKKHHHAAHVVQWLPSTANLKLGANPILQKRQDAISQLKVRDGRNAPKLTGHGRHQSQQKTGQGGMFGDPVALAAGVLGLRLLHSFLRRTGLPADEAQRADLVALVDPYVGLLTRCVRRTVNDEIVLLALKCLGVLLRQSTTGSSSSQQHRLPSIGEHSRPLARKVLRLLSMAGGPANSRDEMVQCCTRTLTLLLDDRVDEHGDHLPLTTAGLRSLVSLLSSAALDYDHHNATFALIKALVSRRVLVPEVYDLMEQICGIAVTSRRPAVRQMSGQILVSFLLDYPLSPAKLAGFLTQLVRNLEYEYEEGRAAAMDALEAVAAKLPTPVLDEHAQAFVLPLMLRLVNDASPKVRARAAQSITTILRKVSGDVFHLLLDYQARWLEGQAEAVARAAAQGVGLFVEARPDLVKRGDFGPKLLALLTTVLARVDKKGSGSSTSVVGQSDLEAPREREGEALLRWEMAYHCLVSLASIYDRLPGVVEAFAASSGGGSGPGVQLLDHVSALLVYRHAWVRLAASRVWGHYLDRRNPAQLTISPASQDYLGRPERAFAVMRRLCVQIDRPSLSGELSQRAVKSLVFLALALAKDAPHTQLPATATNGSNGAAHENEEEEQEEDEDEEEDDEEQEGGARGGPKVPKDLLGWLMGRLAHMARRKGEDRRSAVFRFFAAFASVASPPVVVRFLPHILSPLYRAITDGQGEGDLGEDSAALKASELAKEVLEVVEGRVGSGPFVQAYSDVQKGAAQRREARKKARAVEAITDPEAAAKRKMARNTAKKESKKRKAAEFKKRRGVVGPKRTRFDEMDQGL